MFCSKCGKQLDDSALFCDRCGYKLDGTVPLSQNSILHNNYQQPPQIIYVNQPRQRSIGNSSEELNKKMMAIIFFIASGIMMLGAIVALVATKLSVLADLIESDYSHNAIERALQSSFEESKGVIILLVFIYIAYIVFQSFTLWMQCRKREFSLNRKAVRINCILDIISILFITILLGTYLSDATHGSTHFSFLYYVIVTVIIAFKITYAVLYSQAADYEEYLSEKEKKDAVVPTSDWVCECCSFTNSGKDIFCQKCGKNYTKQGWICSVCGNSNNRYDMLCKGCGKYK